MYSVFQGYTRRGFGQRKTTELLSWYCQISLVSLWPIILIRVTSVLALDNVVASEDEKLQ